HVYSSFSIFFKWTIWKQEYEGSQEKPVIFSDKQSIKKHSKTILLINLFDLVPIILLAGLIIWRGNQLVFNELQAIIII
ncbi:hypothetical protein, partial [Pseudomonas sp. 2822-17]|uniref:hypothetical protein n=1 Tax=Pseudomonas sp. 2822-17 TaxID=1712678 RepID=UPI001C48E46D